MALGAGRARRVRARLDLRPERAARCRPILLVFLVALDLEVQFILSALRSGPAYRPDRHPQEVDRERYGFERDPEDIVVVEDGDDQVWLAVMDELGDDLPEDEEELDHEAFEPEPRLGPVRRFALGLAVIAAFGAVIWFVESRTGWDSLDGETRPRRSRAFRTRLHVSQRSPSRSAVTRRATMSEPSSTPTAWRS